MRIIVSMLRSHNISHERHILAYVYGPLLKRSLDDSKVRWNLHRIRRNRVAGSPDGVPEDLYNLPQLNGTYDGIDCNGDLHYHIHVCIRN